MKIQICNFEITIKRNNFSELKSKKIKELAKSEDVKNLFCKSDFCKFAYDDDQDQDYRCWLYKCICFDRTCSNIIKPK